MGIGRDQLVLKALRALEEVVRSCHDGPVVPSLALRFTLAWLYSVSDGRRAPYDEFWRTVQEPLAGAFSDDSRGYQRVTAAGICLRGIARGVGYPETTEAMSALCRPGRSTRGNPPS